MKGSGALACSRSLNGGALSLVSSRSAPLATLRRPAGPAARHFVYSDPGTLVVGWAERSLLLPHGPNGSGARHARTSPDGAYVLWNKGRDDDLEQPGQPPLACREPAADAALRPWGRTATPDPAALRPAR